MAWNRSDETVGRAAPCAPKNEGRIPVAGPALRRGLIAGLVVVLGALAAWLFLGRDASPSRPQAEPTKPSTIAEAKADIAKKPAQIGTSEKTTTPASSVPGARESSAPDAPGAKSVETAAATPPIVPPRPPAPSTPFQAPSDQVFAMVASAGENVPPLPGTEEMLEESFYKTFEHPIEILDGDTEQVKEAKRAVNEIREDMKELVKGGRPVKEVLDEYRKRMEKISETKVEASQMAQEMMANGDREGADAFVEKVNEMLENEGAAPIEKPLTEEEEHQRLVEAAEREEDNLNEMEENRK